MRLCIVGCILFLVGCIQAKGTIKITKHGKTIGNSHHSIEKNDNLPKLPHDGGILNENGEYIPGTHQNNG